MKPLSIVLILWIHALSILAAEKPNIVLIFTDDQGINDVGCYGSEIPTPNIDQLAAEGVKFSQWYSASSICTPSRFGLLTGRNPSRSKHQLLSALMFMADEHKSTGIQPEETTVAKKLKSAGYETALIGKWHLGHGQKELLPTRHGFDRFIGHTGGCIDFFTMTYGVIPDWYHQEEHAGEDGYATELITREAVEFLTERKGNEKPFFLYLAYNAPHFGKGWSPKERKPVNIMQPQAADLLRASEIQDKVRREFAAMTISLDDGVGNVLRAIDTSAFRDNTLVIFLTDHGGDPVYGGSNDPFRGNKASLFEGGLRVPCLMRWPGKIAAGTENHEVTSSLDLFPTFCDLAGISVADETLDGVSLRPTLLKQTALADERTLFWELGAHPELKREQWTAIRKGNWKYVRSPTEGEFLFDMETDPEESIDLSKQEPERFANLQKLRDELSAEMRR